MVAKDEYDKHLQRAYKAAKFPKPRNVLGLTQSLPPAEMKKLMCALTSTPATTRSSNWPTYAPTRCANLSPASRLTRVGYL